MARQKGRNSLNVSESGVFGRVPYRLRRPVLYPTELRAPLGFSHFAATLVATFAYFPKSFRAFRALTLTAASAYLLVSDSVECSINVCTAPRSPDCLYASVAKLCLRSYGR